MTAQDNRTGLSRFLHEPLFHFLGLAALLFLANALFSGDGREVITVDVATQDYLVQQQQDLMLRDLTESEKQEVIDNYIEDEILVREGRKRGFENSSRIRTLLIQNMRFFMASEIPEPDETELRSFFEENRELFESPASVTYDHVLFLDEDSVPRDQLERLNGGEDHQTVGDTSPMNAFIYRADERAVVSAFGREQTPAILAIDDNQWHGPFETDQGIHFLRVSERYEARVPVWEDAENWISTEWLRAKNREIVDRELTAMRENYRIDIESNGPVTD